MEQFIDSETKLQCDIFRKTIESELGLPVRPQRRRRQTRAFNNSGALTNIAHPTAGRRGDAPLTLSLPEPVMPAQLEDSAAFSGISQMHHPTPAARGEEVLFNTAPLAPPKSSDVAGVQAIINDHSHALSQSDPTTQGGASGMSSAFSIAVPERLDQAGTESNTLYDMSTFHVQARVPRTIWDAGVDGHLYQDLGQNWAS